MNVGLYSVYDYQMKVYLAPFVARNDVEAKRQLAAAMADPQLSKSAMCMAPSDFWLVKVAVFDDETAIVETCKDEICVLSELRTVPS